MENRATRGGSPYYSVSATYKQEQTTQTNRTNRKAPTDESHPTNFPQPSPEFPSPHLQKTMTIFGPLGPSLAPYIRSSKTLTRWFKPISHWYANLAGYRRIGLRYDDLRTSNPPSVFVLSFLRNGCFIYFAVCKVVEERDDVQKVRRVASFSFVAFGMGSDLFKRLLVGCPLGRGTTVLSGSSRLRKRVSFTKTCPRTNGSPCPRSVRTTFFIRVPPFTRFHISGQAISQAPCSRGRRGRSGEAKVGQFDRLEAPIGNTSTTFLLLSIPTFN